VIASERKAIEEGGHAQWLAVACWATGAVVIAVTWMRFGRDDGTFIDPDTRKLVIPGSWLPLRVIMGIFATRYALGMASGMQLEIIKSTGFQLAASGILGAWSGYFAANALSYWRAAQKYA
jgi:hypothetical protein